jgi:hypothetical protein
MAVVGAAELAVGLLLYARPGFLRALTVILAVQLVALATGLATAPARTAQGHWSPRAALSMRWRWLLAVISFVVGAVAAGGWSLLGGLAGSGIQRGVGLAALGALPLLTAGGVLGGLAARSPHVRVMAWAVSGAAVGAWALGGVLLPRVVPTSLFLIGTILLSAGALLDGGVDRDRFEREAAAGVVGVETLAPDGPPGETESA